jgi:hypothetical protein
MIVPDPTVPVEGHQLWCANPDPHPAGSCSSGPFGKPWRMWLTDTPGGPRLVVDFPMDATDSLTPQDLQDLLDGLTGAKALLGSKP